MSSISNIDQVLSEMRRLTAAAQASPVETEEVQGAGSDFASLLKQSVNQVNDLQQTASSLSSAFSAGDPNVDVTEVMIALQKAGVAFQAMTEVRNNRVTAYQESRSIQV